MTDNFQTLDAPVASFAIRLVAYIIDSITILIVCVPATLTTFLMYSMFGRQNATIGLGAGAIVFIVLCFRYRLIVRVGKNKSLVQYGMKLGFYVAGLMGTGLCLAMFPIMLVDPGIIQPNAPVDAATPQAFIVEWLAGVFMIALAFCTYHAVFESSAVQATIGKYLMRIRVCDMKFQNISFMRALGRRAAMLISGPVTLWIGFLFPLFTPRKQALHDLIARCLVVQRESSQLD